MTQKKKRAREGDVPTGSSPKKASSNTSPSTVAPVVVRQDEEQREEDKEEEQEEERSSVDSSEEVFSEEQNEEEEESYESLKEKLADLEERYNALKSTSEGQPSVSVVSSAEVSWLESLNYGAISKFFLFSLNPVSLRNQWT